MATHLESPADELVLWHRLDRPGHEAARVVWHHPFWQVGGTAVFAHEEVPCRLEYLLVCDERWRISHARVSGWIGTRHVRLDLTVDGQFRWRVNNVECGSVAGCESLELAFSPSTHLIALRALRLAPGQDAAVRAARLRAPGLTLEPLEQWYRRVGHRTYEYQSTDHAAARLEVDGRDMILRLEGGWERVAGSPD